MAGEKQRKFYDSKRWKASRRAYIAKRIILDGGLCERCRSRTGYIVDHIRELSEDNIGDYTISVDHSNFQYLCIPCHNVKTADDKMGRSSRQMFDDDGEPLPPPIKKP